MNYYERHLGDYAKDTAHLSILEHGVYSLLLDRYYGTEQGIPADQAYRVSRARSDDEKAAVDVVLAEFFELVDGIWINRRAEEEITKAQTKIKAAKENGKKGGRPRKVSAGIGSGSGNETEEEPSGFSLGYENETQPKAHQTPDTNTQEATASFVRDARTTAGDRDGIPVPEDLQPDRTSRLKAAELCLDPDAEMERFIAHHQAQSSTRKDATAWQAQFRKWLLDQHQFNADRERVTQSRMSTSPANQQTTRLTAMSGLYNPPNRDVPAEREIHGETIHAK
ncbi:YdaU family protein [Chromobacterium violaceum]|uniref:YdaU family protein n=1 Tax=Chromobacterium violaceum TaxID=536 RepID=UPI00143CE257|nr:YdaU family protein [Chromobacterium violaceum]QIY81487.1 YdaU family protein [Chromobacterium violaceum]